MRRNNLVLIGILAAALALVGVAGLVAASPYMNQSGGNTCSSQMMSGMGGMMGSGTMGMMGTGNHMSGYGNMQCPYRASGV